MNYESKTAGSWLSNHGYNTVLKSAAKLDKRRWYVENIEELKNVLGEALNKIKPDEK